MNNYFVSFLLFLVLLSACKATKVGNNAVDTHLNIKQLEKNIAAANFKFDYVQAKAKVNFDDGNFSQSFTANIRIKDEQTIWMSLTGPFGIEGARILIEKDRIQILDKLNNTYYDEPFEYINTYLPFPADLNFLQNLVIGNAFHSKLDKPKIVENNNTYIIENANNGITSTYTYNADFKYQAVNLSENALKRNLVYTFEDYRITENQLFSFLRSLVFNDEENNLFLKLEFSKIKKENKLDFPFEVPDKFKKP